MGGVGVVLETGTGLERGSTLETGAALETGTILETGSTLEAGTVLEMGTTLETGTLLETETGVTVTVAVCVQTLSVIILHSSDQTSSCTYLSRLCDCSGCDSIARARADICRRAGAGRGVCWNDLVDDPWCCCSCDGSTDPTHNHQS